MVNTNAVRIELESKLRDLLARCPEIEAVLSDPGESDWEENAVAMENDEALAAIGEVTKQEIRDIRLALDRIQRGTYGTCQRCGHSIGRDRLTAIPWATNCVHCV
jgi:DnaK suppressor protein